MENKGKQEIRHTPGPWEASEYYITAGKDKRGVPITIACAPSGPFDDGFTEANARLIAAAPELLEALEQVAVNLEYNGLGGGETWEIVQAAISKVKGE